MVRKQKLLFFGMNHLDIYRQIKRVFFRVNGSDKAQPFILQFIQNKDTGKYIISDDLYFELGKYPYPLPSNSMQGMGFLYINSR